MDNKVFYRLVYYSSSTEGNKRHIKLYKNLKQCYNTIDLLRKSNNGYYGFKITPIKF